MEDKYIIILLCLPIVWFVATLGYQILNLISLWIKLKLENIKELIK